MRSSISEILIISSLLASGRQKIFIFFPTDRSWNNYLHFRKKVHLLPNSKQIARPTSGY